MSRDAVFGLILLALAFGYYIAADAIPQSGLADSVGPEGLPRAYASALAALSLTLIVRGVRRAPHAVERTGTGTGRRTLLRVGGMLALGAAYVLIVPWTGYVVAIAGLVIAAAYHQGGRLTRQVVAVGVGGALLLWVLFVLLLGIEQPSGAWLESFREP